MQVTLLYLTIVMIWGSTWIVIPFQLGEVANELSVAYRFGIASLVLYAYAAITRRKIALPRGTYLFVFIQGTLMFSLNYFLVYYGTAFITTGLVAVVFGTIVLFNALFSRLFFGSPLETRVLMAAATGFSGIALMFWPEVSVLSFEDATIVGISYVLAATILASLGNMAAVVNTRQSLPVVAVNAHSMAWAAVTSIVIALLLGRELRFSLQTDYIVSLAYLSVFGSAIAFGCYLALIRRIGAARAAYSSVLFPVVALGLSTFFEDYKWTPAAVVGIILTLIGNWLILNRPVRKTNSTES
jgi:drug/metabolite transporter (DMT)-like permease